MLLFRSLAVTVIVLEAPDTTVDGTSESTSCVAVPGFTVITLFVAAETPEMVAPRVTDPTVMAVNVPVNVPSPAAVTVLRLPLPPIKDWVSWMALVEGTPAGLEFPKLSLRVKVTLRVFPEITDSADAVTLERLTE
jgi:hypothetical protein